ncbi:MAG: iron ABC transporter permease [Chloroflexota bacterium]|nr:iron ABC transporter permease [Chloroflexota bacterium]
MTGRAWSFDRPAQWLLAVVLTALVAIPLAPIVYQSVLSDRLYEPAKTFTLSNYALVLSNAEFWTTVATTVVFVILTTAFSVLLGIAFAILLTRTDVPARGLLHDLVILPFYVSPLVLAFAWAILYGPSGFATIGVRTLGLPTWQLYTVVGISVVAAVYYVPYSYLYATGSLALTDPQLEDAGRIAGAGPFRTLFSITLPLLRPAVAYGTLLTIVSAIELLSIPLVLGQPVGVQVLSTFLYTTGTKSAPNDYGIVAAVSVIMLAVITLLVWLQVRVTGQERRFVTVGGKAIRGRVVALGGRMRWVVAGLLWLYIAVGVALPLVGIFAQSATSFLTPLVNPLELLTQDNFKIIFGERTYLESIRNSLLISVVGGLIAIVFIAFTVLVTSRSDFPLRRALSYIALYPRAVPGIIIGIGFLWTLLLVPGLGGIRNTLAVLTLAFIVRFLPLGFGAVMPSVLRISNELDRAARVAGASWLTTMWRILVPLLRPALASGFVLLFVSFLKEYASALFLVARGSEVIGTTMIELWRQGNSGPVAALSAIQLVITFVAIVIGQRLLGARLRG